MYYIKAFIHGYTVFFVTLIQRTKNRFYRVLQRQFELRSNSKAKIFKMLIQKYF
jgi:hypothetical protein